MPRPLVVKVTVGANDPERCNQGFTVAATAVAASADVSLWLTGEAAWFGVPGRAEAFELPHARPLVDLLAAVVDAGRVNPSIIELEERTDSDRVVECLIRPAGCLCRVDVGLVNLIRLMYHFCDEPEERFLLIGDWSRRVVVQDRLHERAIPQELRRDRGVGANSERALVQT